MTDYTDLKARLRAYLPDPRWWNSAETNGLPAVLRDALAAIEELEQRISMGGSSDGAGASGAFRVAEAGSLVRTSEVEPATSVKDTGVATSGEPPAQSSAAPDPLNCPKCGAHDWGLNNPRCPHCGYSAAPAPAAEPVGWMMPLGERGLIEWGHKRPDTGDLDKWRPLYSHSHEYSDDFTGEIATPSKESLLEDLRLLSNLERAHKMESNSLFIENGQLRKSLKDVLRMLEAAHRQSGIHGTDNKRIVAARSVLNAPPSLYAAPQPAQADEARELLREVMNELIVDPEASWPDIQRGEKLQERIDAYLVRTGGKEE